MNRFLSTDQLEDIREERIRPFRPKTCPDTIDLIFPKDIVDSLDDYVYKDINETIACFKMKLWTATSLMSFRLIEGELRVHAEHDLGYACQQAVLSFARRRLVAQRPIRSTDGLQLLRLVRCRSICIKAIEQKAGSQPLRLFSINGE